MKERLEVEEEFVEVLPEKSPKEEGHLRIHFVIRDWHYLRSCYSHSRRRSRPGSSIEDEPLSEIHRFREGTYKASAVIHGGVSVCDTVDADDCVAALGILPRQQSSSITDLKPGNANLRVCRAEGDC